MRTGLALLVISLAMALASPAHAQRRGGPAARMQVESNKPYAGLPFNVAVIVDGFDGDPQPAQPALTVPGATVTPLGVQARSRVFIDSGGRSEKVTWILRWQVEAPKAGRYKVATSFLLPWTRVTSATL